MNTTEASSFPTNRYLRVWQGIAAFSLLSLVLAVLAVSFALVWGSKGADRRGDLEFSLIKLQASMAQGISLGDFGALVLDARAKLEFAKPRLSSKQKEKSEAAVNAAEQVVKIWQGTLEDDWNSTLFSPMQQLGLVKDHKDFEKFMKDKSFPAVDATSSLYSLSQKLRESYRKEIIGIAMNVVSSRLKAAIEAM